MPTYQVDVGDKTYEVDAPDPNTAWQWANYTHTQPTAPTPKPAGFSLKDIGTAFGQGAVGSAEALTNVAGAGNAASQYLGGVSKSLGEQYTPERQAEMQRQQERMKKAEQSGSTLEEIKAAAQNIYEAPLQSVAQGLGSFVPYLPAMFAGPVAAALGLSSRAVAAANVVAKAYAPVVGTAQGAGSVKGAIYDAVYKAEKESGLSEDEAKQKADAAQDYAGKNLDQIALGAGLGYVASKGGVEKFLTKEGREKAGEKLLPRVGKAIGEESITEGAQGGQEQLAANIALQRTGRDVPTFQGVAGKATQEGVIGGLTAGPVAAIGGGPKAEVAPEVKPEVKPPVTPEVQPATSPEQTRARVEDVTGVSREAAPSAQESAETFARTARMDDEEGRAYADRVTQERLLRQQKEMDAEAERIAELNKKQGIQSPVPPARTAEEKPSIYEEPPVLAKREDLLAKQAAVDKRRLEAGLPTGESSVTPGVQPEKPAFVEPKPTPKIVDERPLQERAAKNRLLVMRNMLKNQGGDPNSLTIAPHPKINDRFVIQSLDVPTKFTKNLPATAINRPESPAIIDPVNAYVEIQRRTNTLAARRFVSDFEAGKITREDVETAIKQERKANQPPPLTYTPTGEPGIIAAETSKPRGNREVPTLGTQITTAPEVTSEEPPIGEEPPAPTATLPKTLEEFRQRMPIVSDKPEVRSANSAGNFSSLTQALQLSSNPTIKRIGELGAGIASKITLRKPGNVGKGVLGVYRYADDSIQMAPSHAGDEHTNAHETVHALISKAQRYPTDRQKPVAAQIKELYLYVQKELNKKGITAYGLTNEREFAAEAMTNPQFQFELMQIPYRGKRSAWSQFTKLVADLLGIQNTNALTEVMNLVDRLATQKQPRKTIADKGLVDEIVERPPTLDTSGLTKVIKGRDPQLQAAAQQLKEGKIKREEYEQYVNYYTPIEAVEANKLRPPSTEEAMQNAVASNKANLVNQPIADGSKVGLRLDIPSTRAGVPTVSVHEGASGKASQGKSKSYTSTAYITNATFETRSQKAGLDIAVGAGKEPLQTVEGTWVNKDSQSVFEEVKGLLNNPDWVQVGFDPTRHGYFYDRNTGDPVASASEVYQIGTLLVAKDVKYAPKEKFLYSLRGKPEGQITAFEQSLRTLLNKFGLKEIGLKLSEGMRDEGSYAAKLIQIAADSANPIRTLRHEAIHALRELGFFTDAQWKSLSKMAKDKWIDQYLKQRNIDGKPLKAGEESRYDAYMREYKGDMEKITEEAVADAFADFDTKPPSGMIQAIIQRLRNLFQSIRSALTKMESAEQIFGKVEKGALKPSERMESGERKSLTTPVFRQDLGSPDWLQEQIDYAKERGRNRYGVPYMGKMTGSFKGNINVPMSILSKLSGQRGEQNAKREDSLDYIRKNWDEVSKEPPYIEVAHNGEAWISEGNHRIMVAAEKGLDSLPVEIRYFDGGQKENGPLKPEKILKTESKSLRDRATANFKRWFADSTVVDEKGEPLVVYHGTNKDVAEFKGDRFYFAETPEYANGYAEDAGGNVVPAYLSLNNPLSLEGAGTGEIKAKSFVEILAEKGLQNSDLASYITGKYKTALPIWAYMQDPAIRAEIKAAGFDGVIQMESNGAGSTKAFIAFKPTQIKSATGNNGDYSLTDADIRKSLRTTAAVAKEKAQELLQKRKPINKEALSDVDPEYVTRLGKVFNPESKTIIDKIEGLKDGFWRRTAQGLADQYRTIKDYDMRSYMLARMSKTQDGGLEGLMFNGHIFNDGGALNIKKNTKGLMESLKPVGLETDRYMMWIALNRESNLPEGKRSPGISELVKDKDQLSQGTLNGKSRLEVYQSVKEDMSALNKSVLDLALDMGVINSSKREIAELESRDMDEKKKAERIAYLQEHPGAYERFTSDLFYIPFYKAMEDGDIQSAVSSAGLTNQKFSAELKGMSDKPFADLMENTLRNWSHILSASMKNQAALSTVEATMDAGATIPNMKPGLAYEDGQVISTRTGEVVGDGMLRPEYTESGKGMVKVMKDGQPMYFEVLDPMLLDSITSIGYMGPKSKFLDVARDFKNMLQYGVTISPTFKVNNLIRDSIGAMAVSDLKKSPVVNVIEGMSLANKDNPTYIEALAGGAIFNFGSTYEGDQAKLVKRLLKQGVKEEHILDTKDKIEKGLKGLWDKYQELGNKSEAANRLALYKQLRDKGMSHLEASFQARDLMDFSMQGSWPAFRTVTQVVPFLNARVQGLYKLGRDGVMPTSRVLYNTITGKEIEATDKQKAYSFGIVTTAVSLASMALYMAFKDDEDYKKRDEWDRDNFWWIKLPGMDYALRVPKPFEIGAFGTMSERILEQIIDQGAEGKTFGDSISRMLFDTFAMNPMPQMFKPLLDLYANKDSFTGAPIESAGMERLSKQERMTELTSPLAKALGGMTQILGEKGELSPAQVDYAIKGYFGWLGSMAATTSMYATMPFKEGAYPDTNWMDKASLGLVRTLPSNQSKYTTAFYDANKEISQAFSDMRHYADIGDSDKVQQLLEEKGDKIRLSKLYDKTAKNMANVRKQIRIIMNDDTLDGATKKAEIDRMKEIISMYAEQAESVRKSLK